MANFKKSFNFRNGVQVDTDNFIVNSNGLVGIGTSIPKEALDVFGNINISGTLESPNIISGISTIAQIISDNIEVTGIVTAGTFSGSASGLTDIYAIAVDGWYINNSHISTNTTVSIGTDIPSAQFTVNDDVSIGSTLRVNDGHIILNSFGGSENTSDITGDNKGSGLGFDVRFANNGTSVLGALISSKYNIDKCDLHINLRENFNQNFPNSPALSITSNQNVGVNTDNPTSALYVYGDGYYTGVVTSTNYYGDKIYANQLFGSLIGTASTALDLDDSADVVVNSISSGFSTTGISTVSNSLYVGNNIGIGTENPLETIHIVKNVDSGIQITATNSESSLTLGRNINANTSSGQLKFGNNNSSFPLSTQNSLDIINNDVGNINFYLNPGGIGNGQFNWINKNLSSVMTLTQEGYLGVNNSSPGSRLSVDGDAIISGVATVSSGIDIGGDANISGDSIISQKLTVAGNSISQFYDLQIGGNPQTESGVGLDLNGNIRGSGNLEMTGDLAGSTLNISGNATFSSGTLSANNINSSGTSTFNVLNVGSIDKVVTSRITSTHGIYSPSGIGTFSSIDVNTLGSISPSSISLVSPGNVTTSGSITANLYNTTGSYSYTGDGVSNGTNKLSFYLTTDFDDGISFEIDNPNTNAFGGINFTADGTNLIIEVIGIGKVTLGLTP